jgi:hypothetical protein
MPVNIAMDSPAAIPEIYICKNQVLYTLVAVLVTVCVQTGR